MASVREPQKPGAIQDVATFSPEALALLGRDAGMKVGASAARGAAAPLRASIDVVG